MIPHLIKPYEKLLWQITAACLPVFWGDVHFTSLHGILGVYSVHPFVGSLLTIFTIIVITNSLNLIDGVDGLVSGIGIISSFSIGFKIQTLYYSFLKIVSSPLKEGKNYKSMDHVSKKFILSALWI